MKILNNDEEDVNAKAAEDAAAKDSKVQEDIEVIEDIFKYIDETTRRLIHAQMQVSKQTQVYSIYVYIFMYIGTFSYHYIVSTRTHIVHT